MRILSILILALVVAHPDQVSGKKKAPKKGGPCGKTFIKQLNGKCYYMGLKKLNWFGAQNNCLRKELNLADLATPEEYNAVVNYLRSHVGLEDFWFGGNDLHTEGRFTYISTGQVVRYLGENGMVEATQHSNLDDCLELRLRNNHTIVLDVNCHDKKYFICQKPDQKCARPSEDEEEDAQTHSHEHLHHFHHDAAKKEKHEAAKVVEEVESDSRPLDNSNSTEIGVSNETPPTTESPGDQNAESEGEGEGEGEGDSESQESTTAGTNSTEPAAEATAKPAANAANGSPASNASPPGGGSPSGGGTQPNGPEQNKDNTPS